MDITTAFEAVGGGSIPSEGTRYINSILERNWLKTLSAFK